MTMTVPVPDPRPAGPPDTAADPADALVEKLPTAECWRLLEQHTLGRLAVEGTDGVPDVFPVNYLVHSGEVYIRSAPGGKLVDIAARPVAAFEVDGESAARRWSVVIRGTAQQVEADPQTRESGILALTSWSPTRKQHVIRLTPSTVTGRRFHRRLPDVRPHAAAPLSGPGPASVGVPPADEASKPLPIPHFPPLRED